MNSPCAMLITRIRPKVIASPNDVSKIIEVKLKPLNTALTNCAIAKKLHIIILTVKNDQDKPTLNYFDIPALTAHEYVVRYGSGATGPGVA